MKACRQSHMFSSGIGDCPSVRVPKAPKAEKQKESWPALLLPPIGVAMGPSPVKPLAASALFV